MNNLNYPLRISKNKPPSVFRKREMSEQKINEENIENNLVFCIDLRKPLFTCSATANRTLMALIYTTEN